MQSEVHSTPTVAMLLLFGAGGHGCVVADAALLQGRWGQICAADRDASRCDGQLLGRVKLIELASANALDAELHISIGNNAAREREALLWGFARLVSVQHPDATVSCYARLDAGCFVAARAVVAPRAQIGTGTIINHAAVLDHDAQVGAFSHVAPGALMGGGARIGARVLLGAGAVVLPGVSVADDVIVGAGCVVTHSLTQAGTYVGVPAVRVK